LSRSRPGKRAGRSASGDPANEESAHAPIGRRNFRNRARNAGFRQKENDMRTMTTRTIAFAAAAAAALASATPSLARNMHGDHLRAAPSQSYNDGNDGAYGAYAQQSPYGAQGRYDSYGSPAPGYLGMQTHCWQDDGYGRYVSCDRGGN
jgi:hypothetical protein